jgi:endonuclease/exonuclease/phosphatase (EEP) superfamily protein YafD
VYNEGDDGPSGHPVDNEYTIYGGEKIDYIFANGGSYDRVDGNAVTPERWSDHWHLYGWFDG